MHSFFKDSMDQCTSLHNIVPSEIRSRCRENCLASARSGERIDVFLIVLANLFTCQADEKRPLIVFGQAISCFLSPMEKKQDDDPSFYGLGLLSSQTCPERLGMRIKDVQYLQNTTRFI